MIVFRSSNSIHDEVSFISPYSLQAFQNYSGKRYLWEDQIISFSSFLPQALERESLNSFFGVTGSWKPPKD